MPKRKYVTDWSQVPVVVDVAYVSVLLGLHPRTVEIYLKKGKLKGKKAGRVWRIPKESLEEYVGRNNHDSISNNSDMRPVER